MSNSVHSTYRYPARFSPDFARAAIQAFTKRGDLIIDPFCGGGTTAIEAVALGRKVIANDLSPLAAFVTEARTSLYSDEDFDDIEDWIESCLRLRLWSARALVDENPAPVIGLGVVDEPELRNVRTLILAWEIMAGELGSAERLARLILLRCGQRSLDLKRNLPSTIELRTILRECAIATCHAVSDLGKDIRLSWGEHNSTGRILVACGPCEKIRSTLKRPRLKADLLLFSPPYAGVHVLYSKWQVLGRRETALPFQLAGVTGETSEHVYTLGHRDSSTTNDEYMDRYELAAAEMRELMKPDSTMVQMIGFSDPKIQLPLLLKVLERQGFHEVRLKTLSNSSDGRLWRPVPGQKWYTAVRELDTKSSREVVLVHRTKGH
jgi:DNA modification methylase